jgi:hypothetical protein
MGNLGAVAPDAAMLDINFKPSSEFVLCRNKHGTPTAIYKEGYGTLIHIDLERRGSRSLDLIRF